ncbi:MAG: hypothetical protein K1W17_11280 [Oscillospiraceae bacterium]
MYRIKLQDFKNTAVPDAFRYGGIFICRRGIRPERSTIFLGQTYYIRVTETPFISDPPAARKPETAAGKEVCI